MIYIKIRVWFINVFKFEKSCHCLRTVWGISIYFLYPCGINYKILSYVQFYAGSVLKHMWDAFSLKKYLQHQKSKLLYETLNRCDNRPPFYSTRHRHCFPVRTYETILPHSSFTTAIWNSKGNGRNNETNETDTLGLKRGGYLFPSIMLVVIWMFSITPEFRWSRFST